MAKTRRLISENLKNVDIVIELLDARIPRSSENPEIARLIGDKPSLTLFNKASLADPEATRRWQESYKSSGRQMLAVDCKTGENLSKIGTEVRRILSQKIKTWEEKGMIGRRVRAMIVGIPNVGKSSLVNRLLGFERVIVSDVAGTTRDAVDTPFTYNGAKYTLIDTAGMRRKRGIDDESVERYSVLRAMAAIGRADVVMIVLDATAEISEQDVRIAGLVHEEGKPSVIVMNKWDKVEKDTHTVNRFRDKLAEQLSFMSYFQAEYVSALTGKRVERLLDIAETVYSHASRRITTGLLNEVIGDAVRATEPPTHSGRRLKILYGTQASVCPPTFVIFVNDEELVHFSYKRYLENCLRRSFDFTGTPVRLKFVGKKEEK